MKNRYETEDVGSDGFYDVYVINDNLTGKQYTDNGKEVFKSGEAHSLCKQLNIKDEQIRKSEQIMRVAGIKGTGVNLCNEFNFSDLWEVVEWVGYYVPYSIYVDFRDWWFNTYLFCMNQYDMQCAIVDKIHELVTEAGMIK